MKTTQDRPVLSTEDYLTAIAAASDLAAALSGDALDESGRSMRKATHMKVTRLLDVLGLGESS